MPLGIIGGVISALNVGKPIDRTISVVGQSMLTVPEFVSGIVLIVVFAVELGWLPVTATAPAGSGFFTQLKYLILPVIPLVMVLFGYIARMARVGTVEALESDYARTATLKGLPRGVMIRRHVLRNSLLPTITVIATQTGYLIGGLVVVETLFRYNGIGLAHVQRRQPARHPDARGVRADDRRRVHDRDAGGRHRVLAAQSADPAEGGRMSIVDIPVEDAGALAAGRHEVRREVFRELAALADVHRRRDRAPDLDHLRDLRLGDRAAQPLRAEPRGDQQGAVERPSGSGPTSSGATCSRA